MTKVVDVTASHVYARILVISSYDPSFPSSADMMEGVHSVFLIDEYRVEFEFMDTKTLPDDENKKNLWTICRISCPINHPMI